MGLCTSSIGDKAPLQQQSISTIGDRYGDPDDMTVLSRGDASCRFSKTEEREIAEPLTEEISRTKSAKAEISQPNRSRVRRTKYRERNGSMGHENSDSESQSARKDGETGYADGSDEEYLKKTITKRDTARSKRGKKRDSARSGRIGNPSTSRQKSERKQESEESIMEMNISPQKKRHTRTDEAQRAKEFGEFKSQNTQVGSYCLFSGNEGILQMPQNGLLIPSEYFTRTDCLPVIPKYPACFPGNTGNHCSLPTESVSLVNRCNWHYWNPYIASMHKMASEMPRSMPLQYLGTKPAGFSVDSQVPKSLCVPVSQSNDAKLQETISRRHAVEQQQTQEPAQQTQQIFQQQMPHHQLQQYQQQQQNQQNEPGRQQDQFQIPGVEPFLRQLQRTCIATRQERPSEPKEEMPQQPQSQGIDLKPEEMSQCPKHNIGTYQLQVKLVPRQTSVPPDLCTRTAPCVYPCPVGFTSNSFTFKDGPPLPDNICRQFRQSCKSPLHPLQKLLDPLGTPLQPETYKIDLAHQNGDNNPEKAGYEIVTSQGEFGQAAPSFESGAHCNDEQEDNLEDYVMECMEKILYSSDPSPKPNLASNRVPSSKAADLAKLDDSSKNQNGKSSKICTPENQCANNQQLESHLPCVLQQTLADDEHHTQEHSTLEMNPHCPRHHCHRHSHSKKKSHQSDWSEKLDSLQLTFSQFSDSVVHSIMTSRTPLPPASIRRAEARSSGEDREDGGQCQFENFGVRPEEEDLLELGNGCQFFNDDPYIKFSRLPSDNDSDLKVDNRSRSITNKKMKKSFYLCVPITGAVAVPDFSVGSEDEKEFRSRRRQLRSTSGGRADLSYDESKYSRTGRGSISDARGRPSVPAVRGRRSVPAARGRRSVPNARKHSLPIWGRKQREPLKLHYELRPISGKYVSHSIP